MKLELEIYSALCSTSLFVINGIKANSNDFGQQFDAAAESAEPYGCGDMQFRGHVQPKENVLEKYSITVPEYNFIVNQLEEGLSFGNCGWCV